MSPRGNLGLEAAQIDAARRRAVRDGVVELLADDAWVGRAATKRERLASTSPVYTSDLYHGLVARGVRPESMLEVALAQGEVCELGLVEIRRQAKPAGLQQAHRPRTLAPGPGIEIVHPGPNSGLV